MIGKIKRFATIAAVLTLSTAAFASDYDHKIELKNTKFEWRVNGKNLDIRLSARTKGWVAVGFGSEASMQNANLILAYVNQGQVKISDQWGVRGKEHVKDILAGGVDNIQNAKGSETLNKTIVSFTIPLDSGDDKDFKIDPDKDTIVLLAYGKDRDSFQSRHAFRTALKVNLRTGEFAK